MGLVINNNVAALNAQHNLTRTSNALAKSLERLSSGLKINRGADGPAALVISEQQRAQIAGLQAAIANTGKAVSLVQTAEGALNELNSLLVKIRGLALDSANNAVNDANALAANQAEVQNALDTIDRIASNTQFGTKKLLDGSAGVTGTVDDADVTFLNATVDSTAATHAVAITTAGQRGHVKAAVSQTSALAADETLTINGVQVSLAAGLSRSQVQARINEFTSQTGVAAEDYQAGEASVSAYTTGGGTANATAATALNSLDQNTADYADGDTIAISGTDADGTTVAATDFTYGAGNDGTTLGDLVTFINAQFTGGAQAKIEDGKIVIYTTATSPSTTTVPALTIADNVAVGSTTFAAITDDYDVTRLRTVAYGSAATVTVQSTLSASSSSSGIGTSSLTDSGVDIDGTIAGIDGSGVGNVLTGTTGAGKGISLEFGAAAGSTINTVTGAQGNVTITDQSLVFQIGANANQTAKIAVSKAKTEALGLNVTGNQFANLSEIDVRTASGAQDAIAIVDKAIDTITTLRGDLGAFQQNTLESNANNLRTTLENTVSAESIIRDTDFAEETANFTKNQILIQAGTTVLANANQVPQLVLDLLRR